MGITEIYSSFFIKFFFFQRWLLPVMETAPMQMEHSTWTVLWDIQFPHLDTEKLQLMVIITF